MDAVHGFCAEFYSMASPSMAPTPHSDAVRLLLARWREDAGGTYRSWFLWPERLKNFRAIRRGVAAVVSDIEAGTFGNLYKGSSLETVVGAIAEQRQLFKGADHAFLWKPKLRIPDIYENQAHQRAFGRFLHSCNCGDEEADVLQAIHTLNALGIKGLGPAAANLLYFLHPTVAPPFNTAIVNGYNALTGSKVKLGKWSEYLAMREGILRLNEQYRDLLSNDLGAVGGFLFDLGSGRYPVPPHNGDVLAREQWERDLAAAREAGAAARRDLERGSQADYTHTRIQGWLRDTGRALGFDAWVAANDRGRPHEGGCLGDGCLAALPPAVSGAAEAVRLIDVLWLERGTGRVAAGFEVEHTTSIYSGIVRLLDLALGDGGTAVEGLFLVALGEREPEVRDQLARPAFRHAAALRLSFLAYDDLDEHRTAIVRFGQGMKPIHAIARPLLANY
jgi:type II restriction enzyme